LTTGSTEPLGAIIETSATIEKKQSELKEMELEQQTIDKEKSKTVARSQKLKEDL
jgi:hypothetical protein